MFPTQGEECVRRGVGAYRHDTAEAAPPESQPVAPDPVATPPDPANGAGETAGWCSSVRPSMRGLAVRCDAYERVLDDDRYGDDDDEDAHDDGDDQYGDYEDEDDLYEDDEDELEDEEEEEDEEEVL